MNEILDNLYEYAVSIRRKLHEYPEIGFELEKTVRLVSGELDKMGITYTYKYGKGKAGGAWRGYGAFGNSRFSWYKP